MKKLYFIKYLAGAHRIVDCHKLGELHEFTKKELKDFCNDKNIVNIKILS